MWYIIQLLSILIQQTIHVQARVDASAAAGYAQPTGYDCRYRDMDCSRWSQLVLPPLRCRSEENRFPTYHHHQH